VSALTIHPLRALKDNYVYLVVDGAGQAAAVDPGEAAPVLAAIGRLGVTLREIWCTHHHYDHVGGVEALCDAFGALAVLGSAYDLEHGRVPRQTRGLADGERFSFGGHEATAMAIPAHTLGHVAIAVDGNVFTGDTLFGAGCGRLFEGTPAQMHAALARLAALPDDTRVWCGHEYTLHNLKFAR
jgi:hydroxyacylglutathione hydrolase